MKNKKFLKSFALTMIGTTVITPMFSNVYANEIYNNKTVINQEADYLQSEQTSGEWVKLPELKNLQVSDNNYVLKNINTGETISDVVEIINGERTELTADEAINKLNATEDEVISNQPRAAYKVFSKTSTQKYTGSARKITHDVKGPAKINYTHSIGTTVTHQFSTSSSSEQLKIQQNSGVSWTKSVSMEYTGSRSIEKGKTAYVAFKPYYTQVNGQLKSFTSQGQLTGSKSVYGRTPRKTAVGCDGLEYLQYK